MHKRFKRGGAAINPLLETLDNLGITSREKGKTFVTVEILENMFCKGCMQLSFAEVAERAANSSNKFANELTDIVIHKLAHKKTDLPTENTDTRYFIGQYTSSKGRLYIKQDLKSGDKWIYTAFEENSVNNGNAEFISI